jgi:hypothetical protein
VVKLEGEANIEVDGEGTSLSGLFCFDGPPKDHPTGLPMLPFAANGFGAPPNDSVVLVVLDEAEGALNVMAGVTVGPPEPNSETGVLSELEDGPNPVVELSLAKPKEQWI